MNSFASRSRAPAWNSGNTFNRVCRAGVGAYLALSLAAIFIFFVWSALGGRSDFVFLAAAITLPLMPLTLGFAKSRDFDIFEPINMAGAAIVFGTTLRAFYLVFLPDRVRARFLMMGQDFQTINSNMIWVLIGVASFCLGYALFRGRFALERANFAWTSSLDPFRFRAILLACLALSIAGCALYFAYFGIDLQGDLLAQSRKRTIMYVDDLSQTVYGAGWQSQLARMGLYGAFVLAGAMIARSVKPAGLWLVLLTALLFFGAVTPILGQSRTPLIVTGFSILVFAHYYNRIRTWHALAALAAIMVFVSAMGTLRSENVGTSERVDFLDHTVGSGNGLDSVRTTAIMERMPEQAGYLYGQSYLALPFILVPRAVWPNKPSISLGGWVKEELFRTDAQLHGWPPGFVAEAYMNFGYLGIIVLPFLVGAVLRFFYESMRPLLGRSLFATAIYASILYKVAFGMVSLNIALALATGVVAALPAGLIVLFAGRRASDHRAAHRRGRPRPVMAARHPERPEPAIPGRRGSPSR